MCLIGNDIKTYINPKKAENVKLNIFNIIDYEN